MCETRQTREVHTVSADGGPTGDGFLMRVFIEGMAADSLCVEAEPRFRQTRFL